MNVLSLFDGISCGFLALQKANIKIDNYFASEIDKHAIAISKYNNKQIIHIGDIKYLSYIDGKLYKKDELIFEGNIDLFIGGNPCTNFSFSGKMNGMITKDNQLITTFKQYLELKNKGIEFEGQSYLFFEYLRLLKEINPKYFLSENVVMEKKWSSLISELLGVDFIKINSSLVSAQSRNRLYWTNIPNIELPLDLRLYFRDIREIDGEFCYWKDFQIEKLKNKEYIRRDIYHVEENNKKIRTIQANFGSNKNKTYEGDRLRYLTYIELERGQTLSDNYTKYGDYNGNIKLVPITHRVKGIGNGWTVDIISHIFKNLQ